jgi:hypothetical protein
VQKIEGQRKDVEEQLFPSCLYLTPSLAWLRTEAIESSEYIEHATSFELAGQLFWSHTSRLRPRARTESLGTMEKAISNGLYDHGAIVFGWMRTRGAVDVGDMPG